MSSKKKPKLKRKLLANEVTKESALKKISYLKELYINKSIHRWLIYLLFYVTLFIIFVTPFLSKAIKKYNVGDIATENIISKKYIKTIDIEATKRKKQKLKANITPIIDIDKTKITEAEKLIKDFFNLIPQLYSLEAKTKINKFLLKHNFSEIDENILKNIIKYKYTINFKSVVLEFIDSLLNNGVYFGNPSELVRGNPDKVNIRLLTENENGGTDISYIKVDYNKILKYPLQMGDIVKRANSIFPVLDSDVIHTLSVLTMSFVKPNLTINQVMTEQNVRQILSKVKPVYIVINKGEVIVKKHEVINVSDLKKLRYYRKFIKKRKFSLVNLIGVVLFLILFTALNVMYLRHTHSKELNVFRNFLLVYFFLIANIIMFHIIFKSVSTSSGVIISLLIPIGITSICLSILINSSTAMSANFVLTFIFVIGLLLTGRENFVSIFIFLCAGGIASFSVRKIKKRTNIFRAGILIGLSNFILISAYTLIYQTSPKIWYKSALIGFLNGIVCSIIAIGILPFFENILKIPTSFKLMELSDLNTPILKEMLIEAPGTYHHSLMVANLAESAAEAISSNSMLARVGSIFHDIGKIENPKYFIENQSIGENPHDKLQPSLSASIIKAHVKNGVEKALKLKLPHEIIDFIRQHHGTSTIRFFYEKANSLINKTEEKNEEIVDILDYCYEGPKPQTKETAIVMLADSVEAASKTLQNPSPARIQQMINEIIGNKFIEGELSESNLTLNEIRKISFAFYQILAGVFHTRIEYPNVTNVNAKKFGNFNNGKNEKDENRDSKSITINSSKGKSNKKNDVIDSK